MTWKVLWGSVKPVTIVLVSLLWFCVCVSLLISSWRWQAENLLRETVSWQKALYTLVLKAHGLAFLGVGKRPLGRAQGGAAGGRAPRGLKPGTSPLAWGRRSVVLTALWEPAQWSSQGLCSPAKPHSVADVRDFLCPRLGESGGGGALLCPPLQLSRWCRGSLFSLLWPQFPQVSKVDTVCEDFPGVIL